MRHVTIAGACSLVAALALTQSPPANAGSPKPSRSAEDPNLIWTPASVVLVSRQVAPSVYAVFPDDAGVKNDSGIPAATSAGFVVGKSEVLVIDSMINRRLATQLIALVRAATNKPIRYLVNTSYHGDHSYGNQFFPKGTKVIQHVATQAYIHAHFKEDVAFMQQYFGSNQGLDELKPQGAGLLLHDNSSIEIDLGSAMVEVMHVGFAQTQGDLFVWLPQAKVLFAGNPIISGGPSVPWLLDGQHEAALATLRKLRAILPEDAIVVPGHGIPSGVEAIDHAIAYLEELERQVGKAIKQGLSEKQTVLQVTDNMKQYSAYRIFPWVHSQVNVRKTFEEMKAQH